jgi:hypothetical protein
MLFMTAFRGGKESERARESVNEFWLLARKVAPKAVEELLSGSEEKREYLAAIDKALTKLEETPKDPESTS